MACRSQAAPVWLMSVLECGTSSLWIGNFRLNFGDLNKLSLLWSEFIQFFFPLLQYFLLVPSFNCRRKCRHRISFPAPFLRGNFPPPGTLHPPNPHTLSTAFSNYETISEWNRTSKFSRLFFEMLLLHKTIYSYTMNRSFSFIG